MRINKIYFLCLILTIFSCQKDEHNNIAQGGFLSFSTNGQTLPAAINTIQNQVRFEIGHDVDVTRLVPEFDVPEGCTVSLNGIQQVSGSSTVDFSQPVTYVLEDREKHSAKWQVSAITLFNQRTPARLIISLRTQLHLVRAKLYFRVTRTRRLAHSARGMPTLSKVTICCRTPFASKTRPTRRHRPSRLWSLTG